MKAEIQKLSPQKGDLIIVKVEDHHVNSAQRALGALLKDGESFEGAKFLIATKSFDINRVTEEEMNKIGWFKKL